MLVHHHARHETYPGEVTGIVFFACLIASVGGCICSYDIGLSGEDECSLSLSLSP
jgi:MFS transporter, SP family, sugar:H+ symporter